MSVSAPFIARPVATVLLMVALLLVGIVAYPLLPVAPLPQVDFPTIQVSTRLPGASPETVGSSVTAPLERQFGQIPGVTAMTSTSILGNSSITVQFDLARNIDGAALDIQSAINQAAGQLPSNLPTPPQYRKVNPADAPILVLAVESDLLPMTQAVRSTEPCGAFVVRVAMALRTSSSVSPSDATLAFAAGRHLSATHAVQAICARTPHLGSQIQALDRTQPGLPMKKGHVYHAGHGFSCDERGAYDEAAHREALERTLAWLAKYVG